MGSFLVVVGVDWAPEPEAWPGCTDDTMGDKFKEGKGGATRAFFLL